MPADPDDMVLVRRRDLDRAIRWIPTDDAGGPVTPYAARLRAAVNGEAATMEYGVFDPEENGLDRVRRRYVTPWSADVGGEQTP